MSKIQWSPLSNWEKWVGLKFSLFTKNRNKKTKLAQEYKTAKSKLSIFKKASIHVNKPVRNSDDKPVRAVKPASKRVA